jgi:hypothetical protein
MAISFEQERVRLRDRLLELANDRLFDAVTACAKEMPMSDIAAFIEGNDAKAERVGAGPRKEIAALLRERFPRKEIAELSKLVGKVEPGFLTCVFVVKLSKDDVDVSIMALRMTPVN